MSVARARDLLQYLVDNPNELQAIKNAQERKAKRDVLIRAGFGDVSGDDVLAAIGSEVVGQASDHLDPAQRHRYAQVVIAADGCPPCCPPIDPEAAVASSHGT